MVSISDMILEHTFDAYVKRMNKPKVFFGGDDARTVKYTGLNWEVENDKLKKQNVVTGKLLWGSYYEVKSGLSEEDYIAFPYGKTVVEGADTKESSSSDYYNS